MTTFNTGNPVPSSDVRDLLDNAQTEDEWVNGTDPTTVTRTGKEIKTIAGMQQDFNAFLAASGYEPVHLKYVDGQPLTVDRPSQLIDRSGKTYRVKFPADFPVALTGTWATDNPKLVETADANFIAGIAGGNGDNMVGSTRPDGSLTTVGNRLDLIEGPVIYADDPRFGGNIENAIAAIGDNTTLVIRQAYTVTKPLRIVGKTNPIVCCVGAGRLLGSRTGFTFPNADARGILHFNNCTNPVAYRVDIKGALTAKSTFGADVKQDGDAGIEHYQCTSPRTIECKVDQVLTWAIIHIGCTDTKANYNRLTRMTRQSGIGHATVVDGECVGNYIAYSGLYGIEIEGPGNKNIKGYSNDVRYCLKGLAVIGDINSFELYDNTVALCTYDIQLDANGDSNNQVGGVVRNNRTYDAAVHIFLKDTTFLEVHGNTGLVRVANAYIPQRPEDHVISVISPTEVLILNSANGTIAVGDIHQYTDGKGVSRTVKAVSVQSDAVYGSCWRVTYTTANADIGFGSFFMRQSDFTSSTLFYLMGTRNNNINIFENSSNGPFARAFDINGNQNALRIRANGTVGAKVLLYAGDATGITNSAIVCKRGDAQAPSSAIFGGAAPQKLFPNMIGEMRTAGMTAPNKPVVFATNGVSQAFRLRLNLQGSTKTANTGNAVVSVNGTAVATIPVAQLGGGLIKIDVPVSAASDTYVINLADTYGDMGFASAVFELHTVES